MIKQENNVWENGTITTNPSINQTVPLKTNPLDINFRRVLSVWPFVIVFGILGLVAGYIYLRYVNVIYSVSTSINIEEKDEVSIGQALFGSQRDPFNDKIAYFKSPDLTVKLVDSLGLHYQAEAKGRFKNKNFYGILKWFVVNEVPNDAQVKFTLIPGKTGFKYISGEKQENVGWGQTFNLNGNYIYVNKLEEIPSESPIECYMMDKQDVAFQLSKAIKISSTKESNIINISYTDISSVRATNILNGLVKLYKDILTDDKTKSFSQAISFIDQRIIPLGKELDSIETALAHYKSTKGFIGNTANGVLYLEKIKENEKQLNEINILKATIEEVEKFIENPTLPDENMALVGITDPTLQNNIRLYQDARKERDRLAVTQTENNPGLILADKHMNELKGNINVQLQNYKKQLFNTQTKYELALRSADALLRGTPIEEKELLDKQRMMTIKETLFLTLLQKKEEASIAKASVTVQTKVLYPPVKTNTITSPSRTKVLTIALLAGLFAPFIYAVLKELLNRKIISKKQLQGMTNLPVIAELEEVEKTGDSIFVVEKQKRSMFGEQIRALRTNLNFYKTLDKPTSYIMITSSVSGEGKTFLSINLARSYSLQGKKVALLEFDLRRPKISREFDVPKDHPGLSSVLIGKVEPSKIVFKCIDEPNEKLDLYPSGPIPPNPQELISDNNMEAIRTYLDNNYDIVIIDTPPFGMVADAQILGKWADITLILTRYQQTMFDQIQEINDWDDRKVFRSAALVFNGVKNSGYFGNKYGNYYYKRKYGYGYYTSQQPAAEV